MIREFQITTDTADAPGTLRVSLVGGDARLTWEHQATQQHPASWSFSVPAPP